MVKVTFRLFVGLTFGSFRLYLKQVLERLRDRFTHIRISSVLTRLAVLAIAGALLFFSVEPWLPWNKSSRPRTIVVYGFSILGETMNHGIFPAFAKEWKQRTGEDVEFVSSFAGSGTITNQIILGVPAQIAILSTELDALRLVKAGVLSGETWKSLPHRGTVNLTPFVILTRPGNPLNLRDFQDLTRPGIGIVHPDPRTSGGAQWAILAEYGAAKQLGKSDAEALAQLSSIWKNVAAQASSARGARTQFEGGFGDALITYEQEALYDRSRGRFEGEIVYPESTILSEHTLVVIDRNIKPEERNLVNAFVEFLWSDQAQRIFAQYGFRSVNDRLNDEYPGFGAIAKPFKVGDLGGWIVARREIIEKIWQAQVIAEGR